VITTDHFSPGRRRLFERKAQRAFETTAGKALAHGRGQRIQMGAHGAALCRLDRRVEPAHGAVDEAAHLIGGPEQLAPALPLRRDLLGF